MTKKHYDFVVTLKQPGFKITDTISLLLCLIGIGIFSYLFVNGIERRWIAALVIPVFIFQIIYNFYQKKKEKTLMHTWAFITAALALAFLPHQGFFNVIIGTLYLLASLIEKQVKFPEQIGVDANNITRNSLLKKSYPWVAVSNVVLKDGLLTVDFKNNKLLQKEISEQVSSETEKEFNEFCRSKLNAGSTLVTN